MYFHYAFLLTDFYKNDFLPQSLESNSIILPVAEPLWQERANYFQKLYAASTTFCFGFFQGDMEWGNAEASYLRDSLSLYFFLPNYAKIAGAYLLVTDLDAGRNKEALESIEQLLETQGITPLAKNYSKNSRISQFNKHYCYSNDIIKAFANEASSIDFSVLFKKMVAENGMNKQIILPVKDEEDFKRKTDIIKDFEQWMLNNEKTYADLLAEFKKINDEYLKLKIDNDKLRFRLDNYNDYLKALRKIAAKYVKEYQRMVSEQQIGGPSGTNMPSVTINTSVQNELNLLRKSREEILQWYTKEYEVLPLWYKRFGHVIKMVTGKKKVSEYLHRRKKT